MSYAVFKKISVKKRVEQKLGKRYLSNNTKGEKSKVIKYWRNNNNLRYTNDTTLTEESKELKILLRKLKEDSEKSRLQLKIQKT